MENKKRLIDANEVLARNEDSYEKSKAKPAENFVSTIMYHTVKEMVESAPTVDAVEVVHGQWITNDWTMECECSVCGRTFEWWEDSEAHYCPNCGAKMDGEREDND